MFIPSTGAAAAGLIVVGKKLTGHHQKVFWPQLDAHETDLAHTLHGKNCMNFQSFGPIPSLPALKNT